LSERRRGEQSKTSSGLLFLLNHRPFHLEAVPRFPDHTHGEARRELHVLMRLINSDEGHKHLAIFENFGHGDVPEEHVMRIFTKVEPKLRNFWPDVIDE